MAFREGESVSGLQDMDSMMSLQGWLQSGIGSPPRMVTGEFDLMNPQQLALLNNILLPMLTQRAGNLGQLSSLSSLEQMALQFSEGQGEAVFGEGGTAGKGREALAGALEDIGPGFEEFYQTNIRDVLMEDFEQNIRPGTSRKFAQSGFFSSAREQADAVDMENLMKTLTRGRAETKLAANQQVAMMTGAMGSFENQMSTLLNNLFGQGGRERDIAGTEFDRLMQAMMSALGLKPIENVAIGLPGEQGGVKETGQSFMGGLGSGLGGSAGGGE